LNLIRILTHLSAKVIMKSILSFLFFILFIVFVSANLNPLLKDESGLSEREPTFHILPVDNLIPKDLDDKNVLQERDPLVNPSASAKLPKRNAWKSKRRGDRHKSFKKRLDKSH
jgi:hypothetical protein